jgi:hypothetical protein
MKRITPKGLIIVMKKIVCFVLAALTALSLFGCRVSETTRVTRRTTPYTTTRTARTTPRLNTETRANTLPRSVIPRDATRRAVTAPRGDTAARRRDITTVPGARVTAVPNNRWPNATTVDPYATTRRNAVRSPMMDNPATNGFVSPDDLMRVS